MSKPTGLLDVAPGPPQPAIHRSTSRSLIILAIVVLVAEIVAMIVFYFLKIPNYLVETLLDGLIMMVLILPGLYYLSTLHYFYPSKVVQTRLQDKIDLRTYSC